MDALIHAGSASLALDDVQAAIGFFGRADDLSPNNPSVLTGLADAYVAARRPIEALRLYARAEAAGATPQTFAAGRGLAFDLVGDNAAAQSEYRRYLARNKDREVALRLATSLAISGDRTGFEAVLLPFLQAGDNTAFRTRAFGLAMLGDIADAEAIARVITPPALIEGLLPYLRAMNKLTAVQQASAANLGIFPRSVDFGRDDPGLAVARAGLPRVADGVPRADAAGSRLAPAGRPLGDVEAQPRVEAQRVVSEPLPAQPPLAQVVTQPAQEPLPEPAPAEPRDMSDIFADVLERPDTPVSGAEVAGAVDINTIEPARPDPPQAALESAEAQPESKPEPTREELHPARIWVQVATGRDRKALGFDWRRLQRNSDGLLSDLSAFTSSWGQTNRLLTGPFADRQDAAKLITALKEKGIDTFRHDSSAGVAITPLD